MSLVAPRGMWSGGEEGGVVSGAGKAGGSRVRGEWGAGGLTSEGLLHDEVHPAGFG